MPLDRMPYMTLADSLDQEADYQRDVKHDWAAEQRNRLQAAKVRRTDNPVLSLAGETVWVCGEGIDLDRDVCSCGYLANWLCDWPMGDGKTCDAPLCDAHRTNIAPEQDVCAMHAALLTATAIGIADRTPTRQATGGQG